MNEIIKLIKEARENINAPVDTMGCINVPEKENNDIKKFQILVMLILSPQTKDEITYNAVKNLHNSNILRIKNLFLASEEKINYCIRKVGFHNKKTEYLKKICEFIIYNYLIRTYNEIKNYKDINKFHIENLLEDDKNLDKEINRYDNLEILLKLPGVGNKIAFLFLECSFNKVEGISVDTHIHKIVNRLGYKTKNTEETRKFLEREVDKSEWKGLNKALVGYGQVVCKPVKPNCNYCKIMSCKSRYEF